MAVSEVLRMLPCAVFTVDTRRRVTSWNRGAELITGYAAEEVMGRPCLAFAQHPCNRGCALLPDGGPQLVVGKECQVRHKDGRLLTISKNAMVLRDPSGTPIGAVESFSDITEKKETQTRLAESETRLRELYQNMRSGVAVYEPTDDGQDFVFVDFNLAGERLDGVTRESILGRRVTEVFPGVEAMGLLDVFRRVAETGEPVHHPLSVYSDQRTPPVHRDNYVYKLPSGNIVAIYDDVSETVQAREELRRHRDQLEDLVQERTADLLAATKRLELEVQARRRSDQRSAEHEILLRSFLEHVPAVAFLKDRDGRVVVNNRELELMMGVAPGEVIGKTAFDFFPLEIARQQHALEQRLMESGESLQFEATMPTPDGPRTKLSIKFPVRDAMGEVIALGGLAIDITEQKRLEQALVLKDLVFDRAITANSIADPDGTVQHVNPAFVELWGFQGADAALGRPLDSLFADPGAARAMLKALTSAGSWQGELRALRPDGSTFIAAGQATAVKDADGTLVGFQSAMRDVTAERDAQDKLVESEARLRAIGEALPDLIFVVDEDGRYLEILTSEEKLLARRVRALKGRLMHDVLPQAEADLFLEVVRRTLATGSLQTCQYSLDVEAGRRHFEGRAAPMGASPRGKRCIVLVARDTTVRVTAERRMRELNATLERRVSERTRELRATNEELESFAYAVSHDLRAPLRAVDGFSRAVLEDYGEQLDDTGRSYLERACKASQRMAALIDDLLALSRLTRRRFSRSRVDLSAMGARIVEELRASEPHREVVVQIAGGMCLLGDGALLEVTLRNLLGNAWKFSGHQERARIELGALADKDGCVYFVRDNGAGFDAAYADKLFLPFQRLHRASEFPGNGIGLATVQRAIARHGGRVWAEGAVGRGATFYFSVPTDGSDERRCRGANG